MAPEDDLLNRLRHLASTTPEQADSTLLDEAADEIERLARPPRCEHGTLIEGTKWRFCCDYDPW